MFRYGYTNFQQKGYRFASENEFFHTSLVNRNTKLAQLVNHVDTAHTAYAETEPVAYLGIFTDLDSNQEDARYYFQQSGRMTARNAAYAQGYVQDVSAEKTDEFFKEAFLRLLGAPFLTGEALEKLPSDDCDRYFPDMSVNSIDSTLHAADLDQGLLLHILNEMLQGHRVILHLDRQGDDTPLYSRSILLRIFECLPYDARRSHGFATNVAPERFTTGNAADRLPGAVQLCLVDGDVKLPERVSGFKILDMKNIYASEGLEKNLDFLQMLTRKGPTREHFFEMVQSYYGLDSINRSISMEEYRAMYKLETDLELSCSEQTIATWAEDYAALPKLRDVICNRIAEKSNLLSAAEKELSGVLLPELRDLPELARSEKLTPAWELRMLSDIYANCELDLQKLAEAVIISCRRISTEKALQEREQLPFATRKSVEYLQSDVSTAKTAVQRLKNALERTKCKNNGILEKAAEMILPEIQRLADVEKQDYETELAREQAAAEESVARCTNLSQLARYYDYLREAEGQTHKEYRLARDAIRSGDKFGSPSSYGSKCLEAMIQYVHDYSLPTNLKGLKPFAADVIALQESALYKEYGISHAAQIAAAVTRDYHELCEAYNGSVRMKIRAMAGLLAEGGLLKDLTESVRRDAYNEMRSVLLSTKIDPNDLFVCVTEINQLDASDADLVSNLLDAAGILRVNVSDAKQAELLMAHADQWSALCGARMCKTAFSPADERNNRQILKVSIATDEMVEFLRWKYSRTGNGAPKLLPWLAENAPDWLVNEYATEPRRIQSILTSLSPCDAQNHFVQDLLLRPMPSAEVGSILISALHKNGVSEQELHDICEPSWNLMIFALHYDPMQGEQGDLIRAVQDKLKTIQAKADAIYNGEIEAQKRIEENRQKNLSKKSRAIGCLLAVFFALYGLLPLLALFLSGLMQAEAAKAWLIMELITEAVLVLLGCVLLPLGLKDTDKKYLRMASLIAGAGLLPGILIAGLLVVLC